MAHDCHSENDQTSGLCRHIIFRVNLVRLAWTRLHEGQSDSYVSLIFSFLSTTGKLSFLACLPFFVHEIPLFYLP